LRVLPKLIANIAFHLPRGGYPLARWAATRFPELQAYPRRLTDYVMRCDLRQSVLYPLAKYGHYPHMRGEMLAIARLADPHWVVIDVGANIGYTAAFFATLCPNGRIYAFEPGPECAPYLAEIGRDFPNVTLIYMACGQVAGMRKFRQTRDLHLSSFSDDGDITVDVTTVDAWCDAHAVRPHFIKVDAEGHDYEILRGAEATLQGTRPIVMFEANTSAEHAQIVKWLKTCQYGVKQIQSDGTLASGWNASAPHNFLATHQP
jgi:FkbM family methyltransferase